MHFSIVTLQDWFPHAVNPESHKKVDFDYTSYLGKDLTKTLTVFACNSVTKHVVMINVMTKSSTVSKLDS